MQYKIETIFDTEDALFEVNKQMEETQPHIFTFNYLTNEYCIDFLNQDIYINKKKQALKLPENTEKARWINFRRVSQELSTGIKTIVYFIGFQITIEDICYKRMVKISDNKYELVERS